jgi:hypothetical protein
MKNTQLAWNWVHALESDEYEQGQGYLHDPFVGAYCCLGVLGVVMGGEIVASHDIVAPIATDDINLLLPGADFGIPMDEIYGIVDAIGFSQNDFHAITGERINYVKSSEDVNQKMAGWFAKQNDEGVPFKEIAARIRLALDPAEEELYTSVS